MPKGLRLRGGEQTAASLVQARTQQGVLATQRGFINHQTETTASNSQRESPIARPGHSIHLFWLNALEVNIIAFFTAAPPLFWLVQLYMVRKLVLIAETVEEYLDAAKQEAELNTADPMAVLRRLRHRTDGFVVTRLLARFETIVLSDCRVGPAASSLTTALTVLAGGITLALVPMLLYFGCQLRFLAYQSEVITWWHRFWVFAGLMLCSAGARRAKLKWSETFWAVIILLVYLAGVSHWERFLSSPKWWKNLLEIRLLYFASKIVLVFIFMAISVLMLTFPGEIMSENDWLVEHGLGDQFALNAGIHRTLSPKTIHESVNVSSVMNDSSKPDEFRAGPLPLDLRHRDFSGRSLRGANLDRALLQSSILSNVDLEGASLVGANIQGTNLSHAKLQGADLTLSQISGSNISSSNFNGARLAGATLIGIQANDTQFIGANMANANLVAAYMIKANFTAAYLFNVNLQGSYLNDAHLDGSLIDYTRLWRSIGLENFDFKYVHFEQTYSDTSDMEIYDPEKSRDLLAQWQKTVPNRAARNNIAMRFKLLTKSENIDRDLEKLHETERRLMNASRKMTSQSRTIFLANLSCSHQDGKYIMSTIIMRANNTQDVSAKFLSEYLDNNSCPIMKRISHKDRKYLTEAIERERL